MQVGYRRQVVARNSAQTPRLTAKSSSMAAAMGHADDSFVPYSNSTATPMKIYGWMKIWARDRGYNAPRETMRFLRFLLGLNAMAGLRMCRYSCSMAASSVCYAAKLLKMI